MFSIPSEGTIVVATIYKIMFGMVFTLATKSFQYNWKTGPMHEK